MLSLMDTDFFFCRKYFMSRELEGQEDLHEASIPVDVIVKFSWQLSLRICSSERLKNVGSRALLNFIALLNLHRSRRLLGLIAGVHYPDKDVRVKVMDTLC